MLYRIKGDDYMIKLKISTHSGTEVEVEVEEYNPQELASELNDNQNGSAIALGEIIFSKIDVKQVVPVKDEMKESEQEIDE